MQWPAAGSIGCRAELPEWARLCLQGSTRGSKALPQGFVSQPCISCSYLHLGSATFSRYEALHQRALKCLRSAPSLQGSSAQRQPAHAINEPTATLTSCLKQHSQHSFSPTSATSAQDNTPNLVAGPTTTTSSTASKRQPSQPGNMFNLANNKDPARLVHCCSSQRLPSPGRFNLSTRSSRAQCACAAAAEQAHAPRVVGPHPPTCQPCARPPPACRRSALAPCARAAQGR